MTIYIYNLDPSIEKSLINDLVEKYGQVKSIYVPTERESSNNNGFCFVTMIREEDEKAIVAALNGTKLLTKELRCVIASADKNPESSSDRRDNAQLRSPLRSPQRESRAFKEKNEP